METRQPRLQFVGALLGAGAIGVLGSDAAQAANNEQQHMRSALDALEAARRQLEVADKNKGGHRQNALNLVLNAIREVQLGIRYANSR